MKNDSKDMSNGVTVSLVNVKTYEDLKDKAKEKLKEAIFKLNGGMKKDLKEIDVYFIVPGEKAGTPEKTIHSHSDLNKLLKPSVLSISMVMHLKKPEIPKS
jgi:hypothetical protein